MPERGVTWLLYDGDCRVCTVFATWAARLDLRGTIRAQRIQSSGSLLSGLPPEHLLEAFHLVPPDGSVATGSAAFVAVFCALTGGPRLQVLLQRSSSAIGALSRAYDLLVLLRGRLSCGSAVPSLAEHSPQ